MSCIGPCLLGSGFVGSKILMMASDEKKELHDNFVKTLTKKQQNVYANIKKERLSIYLQGMSIGLILGVLYLMNSDTFKTSDFSDICMFVVISSSVSYGYYTLTPKSTYMLQHIDTPEQINAWLEIYKTYKFKYTLGFTIGVVGYILLGYGLKKI